MTASVDDSLQQLLHAVIHTSEIGLIVLDAEGKIRLWNDWMATTSQVSSDMVQGSTIDAVFPELAGSRVCHAIEEALQHRRPSLLSQIAASSPLSALSHLGAVQNQRTHAADDRHQASDAWS